MMRKVWLLVLGCAVAGAQTRISARPEPQPGQSTHVTSTLAMSINLDGAAAGQPATALVKTETLLGYTQTNGRFDDQGRMELQLTIERFDTKQSLDGNVKPSANIGELVGGSMTAVVDRQGKLVDLRVPKELEQASTILKQLVAGAYGALNLLPAAAMSIGDSETIPSTIPVRLPGSKTSVPYETLNVTTLRAVDKDGGDRVAHFEQRVESATGADRMKVNGTGTIDVNLDRGFVTASATEWTFAGDLGTASGAAAAQPVALHGVIRVTVAAHE
jgi:hypothetical protein